MYSWINSEGTVIKTPTIKSFADQFNIRYSNAKSLACGHFKSLKGWVSTHPKAKQRWKRFTTVLVNTRTGQREILGRSITSFAKKHGVCANEIWKVVNGYKIAAKGWVLEKTLQQAHGSLGDTHI